MSSHIDRAFAPLNGSSSTALQQRVGRQEGLHTGFGAVTGGQWTADWDARYHCWLLVHCTYVTLAVVGIGKVRMQV